VNRTLLFLTALGLAALLPNVGAAPAGAGPGTWLSRINGFRADNGLGPLTEDASTSRVAQTWTQAMATSGTLSHNPLLAQQLTVPWTQDGENVGVEVDEATLFQSFVASAPHRANLLGAYNTVGIGQAESGGRMWTTQVFLQTSAPVQPPTTSASTVTAAGRSLGGMWTATNAGKVAARAGAPGLGELTVAPNRPVVGMSSTASGSGYWLVAADGGIFSFGDAAFYGSTGAITLNKPIVGMTGTPSGRGYWLVASDGGIFAYGDAAFYGSTGALRLVSPIVGITRSNTGGGYRMVAADGGIFSFGDAAFYGSVGGAVLSQPVVAMTPTPSGRGYWLAKSDGSTISFGDAG